MAEIVRDRTAWLVDLRSAIVAASPVPLDLTAPESIEGAIAFAVADTASVVSQRAQLAVDSASAETARNGALTSIAEGNGVDRRPATNSRYTARTLSGPATLAGGETFRGGGSDGRALWTMITTGVVSSGASVVVEAVDGGVVALAGTVTLTAVTTIPGLTELEWISGFDPDGQIGRPRESDAALRIRNDLGGAGLVPALRSLTWIVAAQAVTTGSGEVTITIAPPPSGADQIAELANAIGPQVLGVITVGVNNTTYTGPDGTVTTVRWQEGTAVSPDVTITVVKDPDSTATTAEIDAEVTSLIEGYYAGLSTGDDIIRQRVMAAALESVEVLDVTACTIATVAGNYTVNPTDVATLGTLTITVA